MVKKTLLLFVACMIIGAGNSLLLAAGSQESSDFTCSVCLEKESPTQVVMDLRAVVCNGPGSQLVMHANVGDVVMSGGGALSSRSMFKRMVGYKKYLPCMP